MEHSDPLRETLESLTQVYHGEKTTVKFGSPSKAVPQGHSLGGDEIEEPTVVIDPNVQERFCQELTGPEELRCVTNTLSHELEHLRETELTSKAEFMNEYDDHPQFAGAVINILEDQYIDFRRTQRFPGLRSTQAFVIDNLLQDDDQWPPISELNRETRAMIEGLRQVAFAGYAKGISEAANWLREFLSRTRLHVKQVRQEPSQRKRKELAHAVMKIAQEYLSNNDDFDMPDKCTVCEEREPTIVTPQLGPVCRECTPTGHGITDGDGSGEIERKDNQPRTSDKEPKVPNAELRGEVTQSVSDDTTDSKTKLQRNKMSHPQRNSNFVETGQTDNQTEVSLSQQKHSQPESAELVTMEEMDQNQDPASWWNVPDDVDHQKTSQEDITRFEKVQRKKCENQALEADLQQNKEKGKDSNENISSHCAEHSNNIQESEEWKRLQEEHRQMFRKLTTQDIPIPSKKGSRVNLDNFVQQTAGNKSQRKLYNKKQKIASGNRVIAVSADFSGSMNGKQVKLALGAVAEATDMVGDNFLATCWKQTDSSTACGYKQGEAGIGLICGVNEQFQWEELDVFQANGGTPTADGIDVTAQLMKNTHAREKLMIVITDGKPNVTYGEEDEELTGDPITDTAQIIRDARAENIKIIGLYLDGNLSHLFGSNNPSTHNANVSNNSPMCDIFGKNGFVSASVDNLAEKLVKIYRQQLRV